MVNEYIKTQGMNNIDKKLKKYHNESDFTNLILGQMKKEIVYQMMVKILNSELAIDDDLERIDKNVELFLEDYTATPNVELTNDIDNLINKWIEIIRFEEN